MTREELLDRLQKYEWSDIEFKEAARAAPKSAYRTVSAFANTAGGWLVFGVRDDGGSFEVAGVIEVDKVQNEFLSTLRSQTKLNRAINAGEDVVEAGGKTLLIFHIPESPRSEKPVCLDGSPSNSFVRRGGSDERCTLPEIERFMRDAATDRYDEQVFDTVDADDFFEPGSVRWYRRVLDERNPDRSEEMNDLDFLHNWGFVVSHQGRLAPTRAAILIFGRLRHVRQILPRPVVDFQFVEADFDSLYPDQRWSDRFVAEENLIRTWHMLAERYMRHAEHPFRLDPATLRRNDEPADYTAFREAALNLLLHQDYGDRSRKASIRIFRDQTVFWNPGDAFSPTEDLLDPTVKDVRNPSIMAAFRRIGLSEEAGSGIRRIFRNWQELGYIPPAIDNDKARKTFELRLSREELLASPQRRFQETLGVELDDVQARLFALACRSGAVVLMDAKAIAGRTEPAARAVLNALTDRGLLQPLASGARYELAAEVEEKLGAFLSDASSETETGRLSGGAADLGGIAEELDEHHRLILDLCETPKSLLELMEHVGMTHRTFFRRRHLQPLVEAGLVRMTNPARPQAANQRYVLTDSGRRFRAAQGDDTEE